MPHKEIRRSEHSGLGIWLMGGLAGFLFWGLDKVAGFLVGLYKNEPRNSQQFNISDF